MPIPTRFDIRNKEYIVLLPVCRLPSARERHTGRLQSTIIESTRAVALLFLIPLDYSLQFKYSADGHQNASRGTRRPLAGSAMRLCFTQPINQLDS